MGLTKSQSAAVESAREPLFIQAGAGTGKTFTLTKRIAYGLSEESGPLIESVDRLLTITYTTKAAGELIGRVRAELRAQGLSDEALQVDAAWISTIHSMCRRILFAHAFEMGVDPGANMLSDDESQALSALALDSLLLDLADDERIIALVDAFNAKTVVKLIQGLSDTFALAPGGLDDFDFGPKPPRGKKSQVQNVLTFCTRIAEEFKELESSDKPTYHTNLERLSTAIKKLEAWLVDADNPQWIDIANLLGSFTWPTGGSLSAIYKDRFNACKQELQSLDAIVRSSIAYEQIKAASELAIEHLQRYEQLKRVRGTLDINDLLIGAYRLLIRDRDVASDYRDKFQSIMVDEFQDTDSLQVGIVRQICDDGLTTLATVGDAQQSIYGFRGADLEVYQTMRRTMREHDSKEVELTINYRSQPDILHFVEDIFSKPEFFGGEFLKVSSGRKGDDGPKWLLPDEARVKILMSAGFETDSKPTVDCLRAADAAAVADEFQRLHDKGASYGDMAILVSSTKKGTAPAFLKELRKRNIPCVVAGGSDFFDHPEVKIISRLLRVIANRDDDEALYELLASDFFDVSDDDLLELAVVNKQQLHLSAEESRAKPSLFDALRRIVKASQDEEEATDSLIRLSHALRTLEEAFDSVQELPLAQVMRNAIRASGWERTLASRDAEGGAVFANAQRTCDWIEDFETLNGKGAFAASEYLRRIIESAEEGVFVRAKPGALISTGQEAVRIMTIHSSKGLEFPIVAVADFDKGLKTKKEQPITLSEEGKRYLALGSDAKVSLLGFPASLGLACTSNYAEHLDFARALYNQRSIEEAQRLLYVALTRARDELILVTHDTTFASAGTLKEGLSKQTLEAVFEDEVPREDARVRTEAGALVEYRFTEVLPEGEDREEPQDEPSLMVEHRLVPQPDLVHVRTYADTTPEIYSYSSIAQRRHKRSAPAAQAIALPDRTSRKDTVSTVGSAFHLVAQWLVLAPKAKQQELETRLEAAAKRYELDAQERQRLVDAVDAWTSSERFAQARSFERRAAEYAFCVDVEGIALEGYIDLLCFNADGNALVIDYKTGTSGEADELRERYALQAACYAYALLSTGFCSRLEMAFVRPEADMEEVRFDFDVSDIPALVARILE